LIQAALLLVLIAAMVIAGSALGSPRVIRSLLRIGRGGGAGPLFRQEFSVSIGGDFGFQGHLEAAKQEGGWDQRTGDSF
jgi:hypothetical protein